MKTKNMDEKQKVLYILYKFLFLLGQREGRELWLDKPKEEQDKDLFSFNEDVKCVKNYIEKNSRPIWHKVADGDLPQKQGFYLCYVHIYALDRHGNEIGGYGYRVEPFVGIFDSLNASVVAWTDLPEYKE